MQLNVNNSQQMVGFEVISCFFFPLQFAVGFHKGAYFTAVIRKELNLNTTIFKGYKQASHISRHLSDQETWKNILPQN